MPEKEKSFQDGQPIQSGDDASKMTDKAFDGNIPAEAVYSLGREAAGLMHGTVALIVHIKDGHLLRYTTNRKRSFSPDKPMTGGSYAKRKLRH